MAASAYTRPGFFTTRVLNPAVAFLVRRFAIGLKGARVLSVQGRTSGTWHSTPVNVLGLDRHRYLVSPRGETHWVRNIRASRQARLTLGRVTESVLVAEIPDGEKPPILRAYLREWGWEVGRFFGGVGADAPDEALVRIASRYPVFRIVPDAQKAISS